MNFEKKLQLLTSLEEAGIVKELMPQHDNKGGSVWSYEVLQPAQLPVSLTKEYKEKGMIEC